MLKSKVLFDTKENPVEAGLFCSEQTVTVGRSFRLIGTISSDSFQVKQRQVEYLHSSLPCEQWLLVMRDPRRTTVESDLSKLEQDGRRGRENLVL